MALGMAGACVPSCALAVRGPRASHGVLFGRDLAVELRPGRDNAQLTSAGTGLRGGAVNLPAGDGFASAEAVGRAGRRARAVARALRANKSRHDCGHACKVTICTNVECQIYGHLHSLRWRTGRGRRQELVRLREAPTEARRFPPFV
jgi:hypothetical protein